MLMLKTLSAPKNPKGTFYALSPLKPYAAILRDKRKSGHSSSFAEWLAFLQGILHTLTAAWPLATLPSFFHATGIRTDAELIQSSALMIGMVGLVLIVAAIRKVLTFELGLLLAGSTFILGLMDLNFAFMGPATRFFLIKSVQEFVVGFVCLLSLSRFTHRRHSSFI
jgi:hypothetical protein